MTTDALGMLLGTLALVLTLAMFITKQMMLGFPCVMFWGILGGFSYDQSTALWDMHYFLFWTSMGMVMFTALAMFGLKTPKEEAESGEGEFLDKGKFIDEAGGEEGEEESERRKNLRKRADARRKY